MPKSYNHAQVYNRRREARETERIISDGTYEGYCQALGVSVSAAREASPLYALHALVTRDVIGESFEK